MPSSDFDVVTGPPAPSRRSIAPAALPAAREDSPAALPPTPPAAAVSDIGEDEPY